MKALIVSILVLVGGCNAATHLANEMGDNYSNHLENRDAKIAELYGY